MPVWERSSSIRGSIIGGYGTCERQLAFDDRREHLARADDVVVPHHVAEPVRLLELLVGERDPLPDLSGRLGGALAEPTLELVDVGGDEDRARAGHVVLDAQRSIRLELEHADAAVSGDPVDLGAERPVPLARDVLDPLEEAAFLDASA